MANSTHDLPDLRLQGLSVSSMPLQAPRIVSEWAEVPCLHINRHARHLFLFSVSHLFQNTVDLIGRGAL